ncbi:MAG: RsmG family class I SAM-dependent methyltransferase [Leptospirales bacterium]
MSQSSDIERSLTGMLPATVLDALNLYADLLMEWNQAIRLAGYRTRQEIFRHLVVEPVMAAVYFRVSESPLPLIDFGSGNGSPGVVFSLLHPVRPIFLVERKEKKRSFLNYLVSRLGLSSVRVYADLMEVLTDDRREFHLWMKGISMISLRNALPPERSPMVHVFKFGEIDLPGVCQEMMIHVINSEAFRIQPPISVQVSECHWCIRET